jgi:hypothetical protein
MPIPLSQVKPLCTSSEFALVVASRQPQVEKLSLAEAKANAERARKLFDKWQDQLRSQARTSTRKVGTSNPDSRSQRKMEIFKDALRSFESHASSLESQGAEKGAAKAGTPKKKRALEHRSTRATVRKKLLAKGELLNKQAKKKQAKKRPPVSAPGALAMSVSSTAAQSAPQSNDSATEVQQQQRPAKKSAAKKPGMKAPPAKKGKKGSRSAAMAQQHLSSNPAKQRAANTAAKQSALARSGMTSRVRGHVSAQGKRSQGRRDRRG